MDNSIVQEDIDSIIKTLQKDVGVFEGKTVLITGGAGFLGSYMVTVLDTLNNKFFNKPCRIIVADNFITGDKKNIRNFNLKNITTLNKDASKPLSINGPVDYIIHAAGIASPVYYCKFPIETIDVSTQGTKNILELAKKKNTKSVIFFSSSEIYGDPHKEHIPTKETYKGNVSPIGPRACYDESKRLGETICVTYHRLFNIPVKIVRPFNIYGPKMKINDYRVMSTFINWALKGETIKIHGNGLQTRTYSYVSDATVGFLKVLLRGRSGEVYNIGDDKDEISVIDLTKVISEVFGNKLKVTKIPFPKGYPTDGPARRLPDLTKAKKELGFNNKVGLKEGISRTIKWYKEEFYKS